MAVRMLCSALVMPTAAARAGHSQTATDDLIGRPATIVVVLAE